MKLYKYFKLFFTILALTLMSCGGKQENKQLGQQRALPLPVTTVENKTIIGYQTYPTSIEGIINSSIRAKVSGYIQKVLVDEGEKVKRGQPLFKLETQSLSQDAAAAKAQINVAQVEVDKLVPLVKKGIISNVQLETAKANLAQAKSNYQSITANIGYATVKSPVDGIVGAIPFREGTLVSPGDVTPLTTVSNIEQVYAYFSMNETDYLNFLQKTKGENLQEKIGNFPEVELILVNGDTYNQKGKIQTVTGQIDQNTGTVSFRAVFDNPNQLITNGNSGKIKIPVVYKDSPVVPQAATFEQQGQILVFKVNQENKVQSSVINVKATVDNLYVVASGIKAGEKIVAKGIGKLRNNSPIQPTNVPFDSVIQPIEKLFK
ncbi:efflux RND transporter periplasmic adaptor subunit [Abyssalbus ytuae]|uniref:Efflux RND transporter periplasmic adaptor subunit n=1 Tax=Abyssalbus ytuae TaxID=2926907 RepID=A0A9E6ZRN9_9FLAO|nr:efflux RND transporter periplasmic adaptor subunit [Abyssalbus ytuae]UOB19235.1 efflux RND transporter periplasmic adaptor subunit [Abyssalbus ytuae]